MARSKKRRTKNRKAAKKAVELNPEVILRRAEEQLAAGKVSRAREGFRRLFKLEPEIYRDRYIEVTRAAIGVAVSEGKQGQARQWLDYLKNELGVDPEHLKLEELKLASASGDETAVEELARAELNSEDETQRLSGADGLVLAGATEADPVCRAIKHLCRSEWNEMREALQGVGRKSPFAHWRLFLRGCAAYYQNDASLAESCFSKLPAGTAPARKAGAFVNWAGVDADNLPESVLKERCYLIGESKMADALVKSQQFWTKGRYLKAYEAMKQSGVKFPDFRVNLAGQVTRFFQRADVSLNRAQRDHWLDFAASTINKKAFSTKADQYVLSNTLIHGPDYDCDATWATYRKSREAVRGKSARFHALCNFTRAALDLVLDCDCEDCVQIGNERAILKLKSAIQADPSYEPAYTKLLDSYQVLGKKSDKNKLLDEMGQRFPESKTSLLAAGSACLDRKAYAKGLAYLEKAREAAPLDSEVRAEIRRGLLAKAVGHYAKGSPPQILKARESFELLLKETPRNPDFGESEEFVYLRWSVLEELAVKGKESQKDEKRARAEGIDSHVAEGIAAFYWEHHASQLCGGNTAKMPPIKIRGQKTLARALQILRVSLHIIKSESSQGARLSWFIWMEGYIDKSLPKLTKNDRDVAVEMYQLLDKTERFWMGCPSSLMDRWLKLDKKDPLFVVWDWQSNYKEPTQKKIDQTRKEAEKRGDQLALSTLDSYIKTLGEDDAEGAMLDRVFGDDSYFDENDEDYEEDYDLDPEVGDALLAKLKAMPPAQRIRVLMDQGVPREQAESLSMTVDILSDARALGDKPPAKPKPKTKPQSNLKPKPRPVAKPLTSDPNQYDLPF